MTDYIATDPNLTIVDITDTLPDVVSRAQEMERNDRVFSVSGTYVKVRIARRAAPPGVQNFGTAFFEISGSECGADGMALPYGASYRVSPVHVFSVMPEPGTAFDLQAELANKRLEAVQAVLHASASADFIDSFLPSITKPAAPDLEQEEAANEA